MTQRQLARLFRAAIDFAEAHALLQAVRRDHKVGAYPDTDGAMRREACRRRQRAKERLLRAAGHGRQQIELDMRAAVEAVAHSSRQRAIRPRHGPRSTGEISLFGKPDGHT